MTAEPVDFDEAIRKEQQKYTVYMFFAILSWISLGILILIGLLVLGLISKDDYDNDDDDDDNDGIRTLIGIGTLIFVFVLSILFSVWASNASKKIKQLRRMKASATPTPTTSDYISSSIVPEISTIIAPSL